MHRYLLPALLTIAVGAHAETKRQPRAVVTEASPQSGLAIETRTANIHVARPSPAAGSFTGTTLSSGVPVSFSFPKVDAPTLFSGDFAYRIEVPSGATRLEVKASSTVDIDLWVRKDYEPAVSGGQVQYDYFSAKDGGNETVTVTPGSSIPLQAGTYFICLSVYDTGVTATGTLTATVTGGSTPPPPPSGATVLTSGNAASFNLDPVSQATLVNNKMFRVDVPADATRLDVVSTLAGSGAEMWMLVRAGSEPTVASSQLSMRPKVARHRQVMKQHTECQA